MAVLKEGRIRVDRRLPDGCDFLPKLDMKPPPELLFPPPQYSLLSWTFRMMEDDFLLETDADRLTFVFVAGPIVSALETCSASSKSI